MDKETLLKQLSFLPKLEGGGESIQYDNVIVAGMGGSALPARLLFFLDPTFPIWLHDDFGLPEKSSGKTLYVAISYSGNTKETLSFAQGALEKHLPLTVITSGGALMELAEKNNQPRVIVPAGLQPRDAVIYMLQALLSVTAHTGLQQELSGAKFDADALEKEGERAATMMQDSVPLIYSSRQNRTLSYIWKIMFNETGKMPAFSNVFPELSHNEMQGLVPTDAGKLAESFKVLMLMDEEDEAGVKSEMAAFKELAPKHGVKVETLELPLGKINKLLYTFIASHAASRMLAERRGVDPERVQFIEEFKKASHG